MDEFDRIAREFKKARLPSHKHNPKDVVDDAVEQWRRDNPEVAEKFEEEIVHSEEEMNEKMKQAETEIIDDIGLGRMASSHSSLIRFAERIFRGTPLSVELESDSDGTDIVIQWDTGLVYDEDDFDGYDRRDFKEETKGMIETTDLFNLLIKSYSLIEKYHDGEGWVERGTSDISEGVYRIRIHDDMGLSRMASEGDEIIDDIGLMASDDDDDDDSEKVAVKHISQGHARAISKGVKKSMKGQGAKNRQKKTNRTRKKPMSSGAKTQSRQRKKYKKHI
jgi:hypothetical protein